MVPFIVGFFLGAMTAMALYAMLLVCGEDEGDGRRERIRK